MLTINNNIIISRIPDSITILQNSFGFALYSTKKFKKGDFIYNGLMLLVNENEIQDDYNLKIIDHSNNISYYTLNKYKHFVKINDKRQIYGFDSFMNHSCNPTTICNNLSELSYNVIAFRDINIGDEISCDYALFDYECDGHKISKCECGQLECRGNMEGFINLPIQTQLNLLPFVDNNIYEKFILDHKLMYFGEISSPDVCEIICDEPKNYFKIISKKNFKVNDIIYENSSVIINKDNVYQRILYKLNNKYHIAHSELYIIRSNYREFLGFDSFMNHSCDSNTKMIYDNLNNYKMIATKDIFIGDDLTCNYEKLNNETLQNNYIITCIFDCNCGASNCKKVINS